MKNQLSEKIAMDMHLHLNSQQLEKLRQVLAYHLEANVQVVNEVLEETENLTLLKRYLSAKRVEGCSEKSLRYYESTLKRMLQTIEKSVQHLSTDDLRSYLDDYHQRQTAGKITIDNIRRILSSFFSWLEEEDLIIKSPMRRIKKVKSGNMVKETYSDETLELLRDSCEHTRDLAIIDLLSSTGMRVGELVKLNRQDMDFVNRECVVFGKGGKQRRVYFDARTKIHLQNYLDERIDDNEALFVSLQKPFNRLQISGVEIRLRELGKRIEINGVHPHKFRRTLATMAIDKGMPIEQVQHLLGHESVDTTLKYAQVNQSNVKISHKKFIA